MGFQAPPGRAQANSDPEVVFASNIVPRPFFYARMPLNTRAWLLNFPQLGTWEFRCTLAKREGARYKIENFPYIHNES